nr:hypothetical protein Iba_chr02bCG16780 [Ipomoea batatas]GME09222.1 hypothetical protein Iba_scaffold8417CG0030 [Ipomoea batatas]
MQICNAYFILNCSANLQCSLEYLNILVVVAAHHHQPHHLMHHNDGHFISRQRVNVRRVSSPVLLSPLSLLLLLYGISQGLKPPEEEFLHRRKVWRQFLLTHFSMKLSVLLNLLLPCLSLRLHLPPLQQSVLVPVALANPQLGPLDLPSPNEQIVAQEKRRNPRRVLHENSPETETAYKTRGFASLRVRILKGCGLCDAVRGSVVTGLGLPRGFWGSLRVAEN